MSLLMRRRMMMRRENNPEYINDAGTVYHKHEIYEGTQATDKYQNCTYMETFEATNCVFSSPYNVKENMFIGCTNLKSIKMPCAETFGHYTFTGLPNLEYLELGSIGNPFGYGGYFRKDESEDGKIYSIGTDAGLTLVAYMTKYNATAGFMGKVAENTTIIIYSSENGEILTE